jgi:hypothetical protein
VNLVGLYLGWRAALSWNRSDFYDIFGPTKRSRKGYAAKLGYTDWLVYDEPKTFNVTYDVAWYDKIDTLPGAQNVSTTFTRLLTGEVGIHYSDKQQSIGAVDDQKGVSWSLVANASQTQGAVTPQIRGTFDFGLPLPIPHSSIWLRSAAGGANGDRKQHARQLLFWRVRQQLCRQQIRSALPRIQFAARIRDRRGERTQFRAGTGRVESSARRLRIRRHPRLPPHLAAPGGLRHAVVD